ncbi:MAG TPA: hypothetical protein VF624_12325, partial [Tepidisphaeraceae bacterium]
MPKLWRRAPFRRLRAKIVSLCFTDGSISRPARAVVLLLVTAVVAVALVYGLSLRKSVWFWTAGSHFKGDISSGLRWGLLANETGLFQFYDAVEGGKVLGAERWRRNDYTPLRLTVMTAWARWVKRHYPGVVVWRDDYDFTAPMLHTNTVAELASSVLAFLLIHLWRVRADDAARPVGERPRAFRGVFAGLAGALLLWFNPAIVWNGHCWPQWDVWLVPFYLSAVLLA